eukprot:g655.t1
MRPSTVRTRIRRLQISGALRVGWLLLRPHVALCAVVALVYRWIVDRLLRGTPASIWYKLKTLSLVSVVCLIARQMVKDALFTNELSGMHVTGAKLKKICKIARLSRRKYRPHPCLWNSDLKTVVPTLVSEVRAYFSLQPTTYAYKRIRFNGGIRCDFLFPKIPSSRLAILVPGIGGDSRAPYVYKVATHLAHKKGWTVCVLNPRSASTLTATTSRVEDSEEEDPRRAFSAEDFVKDLATVVSALCTKSSFIDGESSSRFRNTDEERSDMVDMDVSHATIVGFSLGAIVTSKYCGTYDVPNVVKSAICVSGAFSLDFALFKRYCDYYQRAIVPTLVEKFLSRYGIDAVRRCCDPSGLKRMTSAQTYSELVSSVSTAGFDSFRRGLEMTASELKNVKVPMLLMTSLDDPLHHADMIGLKRARDAANENISLLVTPTGGHVMWPEGTSILGSISYRYLQETVSDFADASCFVCDEIGE